MAAPRAPHHVRRAPAIVVAAALVVLALSAAPWGIAAAAVDNASGGTVRIDVLRGPDAGAIFVRPALYRTAFDAQWSASATNLCGAIRTAIDRLPPFADGNTFWVEGCRPATEPGLFQMTYGDDGHGGDVLTTSTQYVDLTGIYGRWDHTWPRPARDACFNLRFALATTAVLHPAALTYDRVQWTVDGGYPRGACSDAAAHYPNGDVSAAIAPFLRGSDFAALVGKAMRSAGYDPGAPLMTALATYDETVRSLRAKYPHATLTIRNGVIAYGFEPRGSDRLEPGDKVRIPLPAATRSHGGRR